MKFRFTFFLLIITEIVVAQNYYLPKTIVRDSVLLHDKLVNYVAIQNANYRAKNDSDSLNVLLRQDIFLEKYQSAINSIIQYRNNLAINNWEGNKLFSFEIYCKSKLLQKKENIDFVSSLDKTLRDKIQNLPDNLLIRLKTELLVNIPNYKKKKEDVFNVISKKDSITNDELTSFVSSSIDFNVLNAVNRKALQILESELSEKFIVEMVDIKTTRATLTATIIRKRDLKGNEPAILYNNIYAGEKDNLFAMRAAIRDYVGVVVNTRGKRNSSDKIEPFEHDSDDLYDIIDWISKQKWCNGKVGMTGGSYLGFSQWAALKKMHPALKTIVPQVAVGIGAMDFPMTNNVFMPYTAQWLSYVTNNNFVDQADFENYAKWYSVRNDYYSKGLKFSDFDSISGKRNPIFQKWLQHPAQDKYWQKMIPYKEDFSKINMPILSTTGFYDDDQRGALYYFNEHHKYNKKAEHYIIIGPYSHQAAQSFASNDLYGYKLDEVAKINLIDISYDWFDYILKQKAKPSILKDKINVQIMGTNQWKHFDSMEKTSSKNLKFYFNTDKASTVFTKPVKSSFLSQTVDFKIRNEADKYYSSGKDSIYISSSKLVIESEPLDRDIIIDGSFTGNIKLAINKKDIDLSIDLVQVKPNGSIFSLSDYIGRASYAKDNTKRQLLTPNKVEEIPVKNSIFVGCKIEKGSKLVIIYGATKNNFWQLNYGTGKDVSQESIKDAKEPLEIKWYNDSYIQIPVLE